MKYDLKTVPNRKNHGAAKWEQMYMWNKNVKDDVVPMSVADMELKNPPEIMEGLKDYLDEVVLGYSRPYPEYLKATIDWMKNRHNYEVKEEWIVLTPGVVNAFTAAIRAFTEEGDGIIINRPIYYPMGIAIESSNLREVNVPLINNNGDYSFDYDGLEEACKDPKNKVLLFCSPHNPTGRVWTKEELKKIGEICLKHDVKIISDEIWHDLILPGYEHTVFSSISKEIENITVTCTAASKSFNIAGMATSNIIIANEDLREKFVNELNIMRSTSINVLGYKATEIAYTKCEDWLEEVILLIDENRKICTEFFEKRNMPVTRAQGTYLLWVNCESLGMDKYELEEFMHKKAEFFTDEGYIFGDEGNLYERINLALPTEALKVQLTNLDNALKSIGK